MFRLFLNLGLVNIFFLLSPLFSYDPAEYIHYEKNGTNFVGYISIPRDRPIDQSTYIYVKFALDHFREKGVSFILMDLNTPGGEVFASQKIVDLLQMSDAVYGIPIVAFIDNWAISAGAMLAYSSRFIAICKTSAMGAAEPVLIGQDGEMRSASEKINSALRVEFANFASYYGRNSDIAEAMVDKDIILVKRERAIVKLSSEKDIREGDEIISSKGKLLTLNAKELEEFGLADFILPSAGKEALFQHSFFKEIPNVEFVSYSNWKVNLFSFLSHPAVSSLLVLILLVCLYFEFYVGHGIAGSVALTALGALLLSHFSIYAFQWLEIIVLVVGAALILLELFVLPSYGIGLAIGSLLFLIGLFGMIFPDLGRIKFYPDTGELNLIGRAALDTLTWFIASLLLSLVMIAVFSAIFKKTTLFSRLAHKETSLKNEWPFPKLGTEGTVYSTLRPAGKVKIDENIYDALTDGDFIEKDEKVEVIGFEGGFIIVGRKR